LKGRKPSLRRQTRRFFTTRRYPIFYLQITKCGCTYLKNLFYYLDADALHPAGRFIHDHTNDLIRAEDRDPQILHNARYVFTVLRNPVDRFFSLYFEKFYGNSPQKFGDLSEILTREIGLNLAPNISLAQHQKNTTALLEWIAANLREETPEPINPHWKPQHERLAKVADFGVWRLTLDGLDWQLPAFLKEAIPDLDAKLAAITVRNAAHKPVAQSELATPDILKRIAEIYPQDLENHAHSSQKWARRQARAAAPSAPEPPALKVLTTHRYPINARIIPKSGSTFLRNLFYRLDHGTSHPDPLHIDADGACVSRSIPINRLLKQTNFVVFRDPFERFMSFYFDKVWGRSETSFPWIAQKLSENRRFHTGRNIDAAAHHENCLRLLGMIENRFEHQETPALNPHWRPQTHRLPEMQAAHFHPLLLSNMTAQLTQLLTPLVPDIAAQIAAVPNRHHTPRPYPFERFRTPFILDRLHALYSEDMTLFARLDAEWKNAATPPKL